MKDLPEQLQRNFLCKVHDEETNLLVWQVLCIGCRNALGSFKRASYSELPCDSCGTVWKLPVTTKALKCKDKVVTITARYPDLDSARNAIE